MATVSNHVHPYVTCQHCERGNWHTANFCEHCGYPQNWNEGLAVHAPESLILFASKWTDGEKSGLYSVLSTGLIYKGKISKIEDELRKAMLDSRRSKEGHDCGDAARHLRAIEHLSSQLSDDEK